MKREIKFRYRLKNTAPVALNGIDPQGTMYEYLSLDDLEDGKYISMLVSYPILSRDEFTGLKDKNGKEIYEGDIIDGYPVEYHAPFFALKKITKKAISWTGLQNNLELEVTGNIYENPELLEGTIK